MSILTKYLINPFEDAYFFALNQRKKAKIKKYSFLTLFIIISLISVLSALSLAILSTLKLGKLWIWSDNSNNVEIVTQLLNDYVYIINIINACVAFIGSIGSFFAFKDGYLTSRKLYKILDFEILMYENKIGNYNNNLNELELKSYLADRIFQIIGQANNINKLNKIEDESEDLKNEKARK